MFFEAPSETMEPEETHVDATMTAASPCARPAQARHCANQDTSRSSVAAAIDSTDPRGQSVQRLTFLDVGVTVLVAVVAVDLEVLREKYLGTLMTIRGTEFLIDYQAPSSKP